MSKKEINAIILETIKDHKRVIFNGNNYSEEWVKEAKKRGLPNIRSTVEAICALIRAEKNLALMEKHGVLSRIEMESRCQIQYEIYSQDDQHRRPDHGRDVQAPNPACRHRATRQTWQPRSTVSCAIGGNADG